MKYILLALTLIVMPACAVYAPMPFPLSPDHYRYYLVTENGILGGPISLKQCEAIRIAYLLKDQGWGGDWSMVQCL